MAWISEKRCLRASLVLVMLDDFTDRKITDSSLIIRSGNGLAPVKKGNGIYIFMNLPEGNLGFFAEGPYYCRKELDVWIEAGQEGVIYPVRLTPNRYYPVPSGTCCLEGHTEPGEKLLFYRSNEPKPWKLLKNYEKEKTIEIFTGSSQSVEYRMLYLEGKDGKGEFFEVEHADGQQYHLKAPLKSEYKKIGSKIYPVYTVTADENGDFFLPVAGFTTGEIELVCRMGNGKSSTFQVEAGKRNRLGLL